MNYYEQKNTKKVIRAYVWDIKNEYTPELIINGIHMFYIKIIAFNVFDNQGINIMDDCFHFTFVNDSYYFIKSNHGFYVKGSNFYGQLGINNENDSRINIPFRHEDFNGHNIHLLQSRSLCAYHCFIYTENDELYGFGKNDSNQIGFNRDNGCFFVYKPLLINYKFNSKLKSIKCGENHSLFLTINGNVHGCGSNIHGQLSYQYITNRDDVTIQCISDNKNDIQSIGCSQHTSYILKNDNILYGFGKLFKGLFRVGFIKQVLLGDKAVIAYDCAFNFVCILTNKQTLESFGRVQFYFNDKSFNDIKCGWDHIILTKNNNNTYYGFGSNHRQQLLLQHNNQSYVQNPQQINKTYVISLTKYNGNIIDLIPNYDTTFIIQEK